MWEGANALHLLHLVGSCEEETCEQETCDERRDQRGASQISYPLSRIATLKDLRGEAAPVACSNSADHLRECCADRANRLFGIGILQTALCVEALMGGAERERLGNDMHAQFVEHDLQRKLGFHTTEQPGRCRYKRGKPAGRKTVGAAHPIKGVLKERCVAPIVLRCCDQQALVASEQGFERLCALRQPMFGLPIGVIDRQLEIR
jgi:hypothetical protein